MRNPICVFFEKPKIAHNSLNNGRRVVLTHFLNFLRLKSISLVQKFFKLSGYKINFYGPKTRLTHVFHYISLDEY